MSRNLPVVPNLDHLRKQAKALLRETQQRNPGAKLGEAQHAVARAYGFASWPKLKAHVESLPMPASAGAGGGGASLTGLAGFPSPDPNPQFIRYTQKVKLVIFFALGSAAKRGSESIEPEDLLLGMMDADGNLTDGFRVDESNLGAMRRIFQSWAAAVYERVERGPVNTERKRRPLSPESRRILQHAAGEADRLHHKHIGIGHFVLGFMGDSRCLATSVLIDILAENEMAMETARSEIARLLGEG